MPFTTILFDLDHTLLDSDESERLAFADTMVNIGIESNDEHLATYQRINSSLWKRVELGELSPNEVKHLRFEQLLSVLDLDADAGYMAEHYVEALGAHGELYPGARELLDTVVGNAQLALITNGLRSVQRARIERLHLGDYFSAVAISGELGIAKPDPAIFHHLLAELDHPSAEECIIVGDSLSSDIAGGHNAGIATCWYNRSGSSSGDANPTIEVTSLDQVVSALGLPISPSGQ